MSGQYNSAELVSLLAEIERRSRSRAAGMPKQDNETVFWEGVLCKVAGMSLIVPLSEVKEILNYAPNITRVPGTHDWIEGVANVRGNLLPIIDLKRFFGGSRIIKGRRTRVLVINHSGYFAGILIDDVIGMRHLSEEQLIETIDVPTFISEFVEGGYRVENMVWPVFSMYQLIANGDFQVAAA